MKSYKNIILRNSKHFIRKFRDILEINTNSIRGRSYIPNFREQISLEFTTFVTLNASFVLIRLKLLQKLQ